MEKANELLKLIEEKKYQEYKKVVNELPEIDVAQWIEELQEEQLFPSISFLQSGQIPSFALIKVAKE